MHDHPTVSVCHWRFKENVTWSEFPLPPYNGVLVKGGLIKDIDSAQDCWEKCKQVEGTTHFTWRGKDSGRGRFKKYRKDCYCMHKKGREFKENGESWDITHNISSGFIECPFARKQDSMLFIGNDTEKEWLNNLLLREPKMFRSDCPIFMPKDYSSMLDHLTLDSHVIFYEKEKEGGYNLVDQFSVNGGNPISIKLGKWCATCNGVKLEKSMNRWDRRTDLMGASFVNILKKNGYIADFVYDENNNIIGSKGWYQEVLFYVISHLNLTVTTMDQLIHPSHPPYPCWILGSGNLFDVCSGGERVELINENLGYSLTIHRTPMKMLAGVPTGTAPNMWVYLEVYGNLQWTIFFFMLLAVSLGSILIDMVWKGRSHDIQTPSVLEEFVMVMLFSIQQGSHPDRWQIKAKRILALTTSMLTLVVFIYYANDITAKMTAGSSPISVHSFGDVLNGGYKVIAIKESHVSYLVTSLWQGKGEGYDRNSAQQSVYDNNFSEYQNIIEEYQNKTEEYNDALANKTVGEEVLVELQKVIADKWKEILHYFTGKNGDWAIEQITSDLKSLLYCPDNSCDEKESIRKGRVVAFAMDDAPYSFYVLFLRQDSEYLSLFNHYLLKGFETGIMQRLDKIWSAHLKPPIKIGIAEPQSLELNNVMFPFSLLAATIVISMVLAIAEKVAYKIKLVTSKSTRGEKLFLKRKGKERIPAEGERVDAG